LIITLLSAPDYFACLLEPDGRISAMNGPAAARLGVTVQEMVGTPVFDWLPAASRRQHRRYLDHVVRTGDEAHFDEAHDQRFLRSSFYPILDVEGQVKQVAFFMRDESARRTHERDLALALEQSRELEAIINRSKSIVMRWHVGPEFPIDFITENVAQLGYSAADLVNGDIYWTDMLHPEDAARLEQQLKQHLAADDDEYVLEYRVVDRSGSVRWVTDRTRAIRDTGGHIAQYESVIVDITERIQRERELKLLAEVASALGAMNSAVEMKPAILEAVCAALDTDTAGFLLLDPARGGLAVEAASGVWAEEAGVAPWPEESLIGRVFAQRLPIVSNDLTLDGPIARPDLMQHVNAVAIVPLLVVDTGLGVLAVGRNRPFGATDVRLIATIADIAANAFHRAALMETLEQRVAQRTQELVETNAHLAAMSRHKDEFLAVMSHELRTPLTAVLSLSEALDLGVYGALTERQRHPVQIIRESGRHLLSLINDMLDLSRIESGRFAAELLTTSLREIGLLCVELVRGNASRKGLTIEFEISPETIVMLADERRIKQMLVNLLGNAVKFTPEGGKVGLRIHGDEAGSTVAMTVWDTGIGIAHEDQARIFEPFVQLDAGLTRQYGGAGVGLALVQRIVLMHEGHVEVCSNLGEGSAFVVRLPWRRPGNQLY
jgi:PAS domain S-box-containing protein